MNSIDRMLQVRLRNIENRQKEYNQQQLAEAKIQAKNAIAFAEDSFVEAQEQISELKLASKLAEANAKLYAAEGLAKTQYKIASIEGANKLAEERNKSAVKDAEQRSIAFAEQQNIETNQRLALIKKIIDQSRDDMEKRTQESISRIAKAEALGAENRLKTYAEEQLAKVESRTLEAIIVARNNARADADAKAQEVSANLRAYTDQKTQDVLTASAVTMREVAGATLAAAGDQLQEIAEATVESKRVSNAEIRAIAESTLADSSDTIRALAMQTLASADNYIKTIAREAVQDDDPFMHAALTAAARQVILDEDNKVAFAIRRIVADTIDEKAEELIVARADIAGGIGPDGNYLGGANLDVALNAIEPGAGPAKIDGPPRAEPLISSPVHRQDWVNIRDYHVVIHEDNQTLEHIVRQLLARAEPFVGPWEIKWKLSHEHKEIKQERFSLDAETTFEDFANYLAGYMFNTRGVPLNFEMFDAERVLVISDE